MKFPFRYSQTRLAKNGATSPLFRKSVVVGALTFACLISCQKEVEQGIVAPSSQQKLDISPEAAQVLTCTGYNLATVKEVSGYLVLESDLIIDKAGLEADAKKSKNGRQYAVNAVGVMDYSRVANITYFIDPSVQNIAVDGAAWVTAINQAAGDWSAVADVAIRFNAVGSAAQADLVFYSDNASNSGPLPPCATNINGGVFALATVPSNGRIGRFISINDNGPGTDATGKRGIMRHEIGHTLGYRHSDMYQHINDNRSEPNDSPGECGGPVLGGNLLLDTPDRDLGSVMVSATSGFDPLNFNNNDIRAAQLLYPVQPFIAQPRQINFAQYSYDTGALQIGFDPYFIAFAQVEIRHLRPTNGCGFGGPCFTTINVTRVRNSSLINYDNYPSVPQPNDVVQVLGVNYKGDYMGASSSTRTISFQ